MQKTSVFIGQNGWMTGFEPVILRGMKKNCVGGDFVVDDFFWGGLIGLELTKSSTRTDAGISSMDGGTI